MTEQPRKVRLKRKPPERPRSLSSVYLTQAVDELHDAGNPAVLFPHGSPTGKEAAGFLYLSGNHNRATHCRTSALFAALAAESYVNEFLGVYFKGEDRKAVDRFTPVNKYVLGTKFALGKALFKRGAEPMQTIAALFKLRDRLVHPKPGFGPAAFHETSGEFEALFPPPVVADYIVMVAAAGRILVNRAYGPEEFDAYASIAWLGRDVLFDYAHRAASLPDPEAKPEPPLWTQILDVIDWREKEGEQT